MGPAPARTSVASFPRVTAISNGPPVTVVFEPASVDAIKKEANVKIPIPFILAAVAGASLQPGPARALEDENAMWKTTVWTDQRNVRPGDTVTYNIRMTQKSGEPFPVSVAVYNSGVTITGVTHVDPPDTPHGIYGDPPYTWLEFSPFLGAGNTFTAAFEATVPANAVTGTVCGVTIYGAPFFYNVFSEVGGGNRTSRANPATCAAGDPVSTATGELTLYPETDLDLGGPLPLRFKRAYASALNDRGIQDYTNALGSGWSHSLDIRLERLGDHFGNYRVRLPGGKKVPVSLISGWEACSPDFEDEPWPYQLRSDGMNWWFHDPESGLLYRFGIVDWENPAAGALEIADRNGNAILLARRSDGLVSNATDGLGRTLTFDYDGAGRLARLTDGTREVLYGYDANGCLAAVTHALGGVTRYTYDATHSFANGNGALLTAVQEPRGNTAYTQAYDAEGRVVSQTDGYGNTSTFAVDEAASATQVSDPQGAFTHRNQGFLRLTNWVDQAGAALRVDYGARGLPTAVTDRKGAAARFAYEDASRALTTAVDPNACTTTYSHVWTPQTFTNRVTGTNFVTFSFRDLAEIRYADGASESYARDGRGNVTSLTDRAGMRWTYAYNDRGQLVNETNPLGGTRGYTYNADGTLASADDSETEAQTFAYDALRRRTASVTASGARVAWSLDAFGRLTSWTNEVGAAERYAYDANGVMTGTVDAVGHAVRVETDLLDRPVLAGDAYGDRTASAYDGMGRLVRLGDPAGTNVLAYDLRGWVTNIARDARARSLSYDAEGTLTQERSAGGARNAYTYDALGRLVTAADALSRTNSYAYDGLGRLRSAADPVGATTRYAYDAVGRLVAVTNALGAVARYAYDALGRVARRTDADGRVTDYAYSPLGRLLAATNALGQVTRWTYDTRGRLACERSPDGTEAALAYDAAGRIVARTNETGEVWRYAYNAAGEFAAVTNPAGGWHAATYRGDGLLDAFRDSAGGVTSNRYDAARRLTERVLADGSTYGFAYNGHGEVVAVTDPEGGVTRYAYDSDGRLAAAVDPLCRTNRFAYDAAGQLTNVTDRTGAATRYAYDAAGRLAAAADATGVETAYGYDAAGRLTNLTRGGLTWRFAYTDGGVLTNSATPSGRSVTLQPDALGRPAATANGLGEQTRLLYDSVGRVTNVIDAAGRGTAYRYEPRGLLAGVTEPDGRGTAYAYGPLGLATNLTDLGGRGWRLDYTPEGRLREFADPLGRATTNLYDTLGRVRERRYPDGDVQTLRYDRTGRLTNITHTSGLSLGYVYDAAGRLVRADGLELAHDAEGRVTSSRTAAGPVHGAAYDAAGRLRTAAYADGAFSVTYTYAVGPGGDGRLLSVGDSLSGTQVAFGYDGDRRLQTLAFSNGETVTYTWDAADRLVRVRSGTHTDLAYAYDRSGRITNLVGTVPLEPGANLSAGERALTFDAASQLASAGYAYDARGRLTAAPGRVCLWDGASRLTSACGATFAYDGLGHVVSRTEGGVTVRYDYNNALGGAAPLVAERDGVTGAALRYYVRSPDGRLLYLIDAAGGNAVRFYHFDRNGSTLALTDAGGAVTDAYAYDPYGRLLSRTGASPQPFTFVGAWGVRQEGAAGLYQMGARYYDAVTGRFLSPEPLWPQVASPALLNPYQYAAQDPVRFIDPSGLEPFDEAEEVDTPAAHFIRWAESLSPLGLKLARKRMGAEFDERLEAALFADALAPESLARSRLAARQQAAARRPLDEILRNAPASRQLACRNQPKNTAPRQVLGAAVPDHMPLEADWFEVQTLDGPFGRLGIHLVMAPSPDAVLQPFAVDPGPALQSLPDGSIPPPGPAMAPPSVRVETPMIGWHLNRMREEAERAEAFRLANQPPRAPARHAAPARQPQGGTFQQVGRGLNAARAVAGVALTYGVVPNLAAKYSALQMTFPTYRAVTVVQRLTLPASRTTVFKGAKLEWVGTRMVLTKQGVQHAAALAKTGNMLKVATVASKANILVGGAISTYQLADWALSDPVTRGNKISQEPLYQLLDWAEQSDLASQAVIQPAGRVVESAVSSPWRFFTNPVSTAMDAIFGIR
jgi:RHS repeat-associated protein